MDNLGIGKPITTHQERDAIHIAIIPVIAGETLNPGQAVGVAETYGENTHTAYINEKPVGIIDPFLTRRIGQGETCWLFLYPNTVTSLKHNWSHPEFVEKPKPVKDDYYDDEYRCSC
jgi:hypothetical protein